MAYGTIALDTISSSGNLSITGNVTSTGTIASSTGTIYPTVLGTAIATTSGTTVDYTGIPSWVTRITMIFSAVSTSGASLPMVQIGSGSFVTTGYPCVGGAITNSAQGVAAYTTGFTIRNSASAAGSVYGQLTLNNLTGNTWVCTATMSDTNDIRLIWLGGSLTLSGVLDRVRLTTVNGTDTFDAGTVNILYE
jgi:hypothetical protein